MCAIDRDHLQSSAKNGRTERVLTDSRKRQLENSDRERERERAKKEHSKHITFLVWCANFWCGVVVWWSGESDWCGLKKIGCGVWIFVDARAREYL